MLKLMHTHTVLVHFTLAAKCWLKSVLSVVEWLEKQKRKIKETKEEELKRRGQGLNVTRVARITPMLIRAHLETCRIITHGFTV